MNMIQCEDCVHWKAAVGSYSQEPQNFGICNKAVPMWDATEWDYDVDDYPRKLKPEFKDRMFFAQDGSDYHAKVVTRKDFFCAHYLEKERS